MAKSKLQVLLSMSVVLSGSAALGLPGELDTTFGSSGVVVTPAAITGQIRHVAVQPADNKIVAVGNDRLANGNDRWAIFRYLSDGSLDYGFGTGGKVFLFGGDRMDKATDVAIDGQGRIVVTGWAKGIRSYDYTVVRLNGDGSLDGSFGSGGIVQTEIVGGRKNEYSCSLALDPTSGKILVAGYSSGKKSLQISLMRLLADGSLDSTFDGDGIRHDDYTNLNETTSEYGGSLVVQPDGKVLLGFWKGTWLVDSSDYNGWVVARYNSNGSNDSSFGVAGKVASLFAGFDNTKVRSLLLQPDGRIVAVGSCHPLSTLYYGTLVARYNANGSFDTSFDGDGWNQTPTALDDNQCTGSALQSDGRIVAAGTIGHMGVEPDLMVTRFTSDGSLDATFDGDGQAQSGLTGTDAGHTLAIDLTGRIVVGGYVSDANGPQFALARFLN
ncbi:MAG: hypothetical protein IPM29_00350 [Planctomycetes bacterium]|nr:hypothetical protein [Planctomycetota bacterium]